MKSIGMESGDDYDQMLRGMFDSCDTVGLGLLTRNDFDRLCKKLSMQEHSPLLSEVLFPERNKRKLLSYETFRDTLILFLTGDAGFKDTATEKHSAITTDPGDCWNNNSPNYNDENRTNPSPKSGMRSEYPDDVFTSVGDENCNNTTYGNNSTKSLESPRKNRRYGRTSKPDMELLGSRESGDSERPIVLREVQVDNTKHLGHLNDMSPENSPWKGVEVSFITDEPPSPIIMEEEEFTGEGKDDSWKNPDSDWMSDVNSNIEDCAPANDPTVEAVQTELENAWCRVVGDLVRDAMDESQLASLCSELGMGHLSTNEDISELFAALDHDYDGFVKFREFSEQMSVFLNCAESNPAESDNNRKTSDTILPEMDYLNTPRDCVFSTTEVIAEEDEEASRKEEEAMTSMDSDVKTNHVTTTGIVKTSDRPNDCNPAQNTPLNYASNVSSPARSTTSSEESRTPDSRGHLSIDTDTSPLCPPVVPVEPRQLAAINRGRRRRRSSAVAASNPAGVRQQRRKSSRSIPLPHYHPASIRKRDELPLSYLTGENERYVSLDSLRQSWEQEGLENPSSVLEALELSSTDTSVSVEALSEVLDMEMDQNIIQKAALILYKRGINHYRAKYEHERAERSKQESTIDHLMSQLQEQEERFENVETNFNKQVEEMETSYKVEIRTLNDELAAAQNVMKEYERESMSSKNEELQEVIQKYEKSQILLEDLKNENEKMSRQNEEAESRLVDAEDAMLKMQEDLEVACRGIALSNRQLSSQRKQYVDLLQMYEEQTQSVQDSNDELFDRLQQSRRRWSSPSRSKSQSTRRKTNASSRNSDTSSYSSASEESGSHHLSTCQLFINDSPKSKTSSTNFVTSSPAMEHKNIIGSDAFAFLTPSTTHARSRVQSYASLALTQPIALSSENCSKS